MPDHLIRHVSFFQPPMMKRFSLLLSLQWVGLCFLLAQSPLDQQTAILVSGPMMGHISYDHARVWVQLDRPTSVQIAYQEKGATRSGFQTEAIHIKKETAFTHTFTLTQLQPETTYDFQVVIVDHPLPETHSFTTPALSKTNQDFSLAMGSCVYINDRGIPSRGGDYQIFQAIADQAPDLMLWLGDNVYLHEQDWQSKTGMQYRYSHLRQIPEIQALLQTGAHYAIWDDHDFGPNDSDRSFVGKEQAKAVFHEFWANPTQAMPNMGVACAFSRGDCDFFLLDNRYFRSPQKRVTGERTILGERQLEWLIDALCTSEATFKFVAFGGLVLSSSYHVKNQNYISNYSDERTYLLDQIEANDIKNVVFLTGDKHYSEMSSLTNRRGHTLYEITSSSLTAPANTRAITNRFRVAGSHIQSRNFALLEVSGPQEARQIKVNYFDADGKPLWSGLIEAE